MASNDYRLSHLYITGVRPTGKKIGKGAYGKVFEVEFCGMRYAAKEVHPILLESVSEEELERVKMSFLEEIHQNSVLRHPNIVQVIGVYRAQGQSRLPVLVMEMMEDSLTSLVEKHTNIPMHIKLSILLDVALALQYLHSRDPQIVHRDLSPNNVLLTKHLTAKLADFGVAKVIRADSWKTQTRAPGTVHFMPPEALQEVPEYGTPLDVFSYAGIILHVVNQKWPTPLHYVVTDLKTKQSIALSEADRRREHLEKMTKEFGDLQVLVEQCLSGDPRNRPPVSDVAKEIGEMKQRAKENTPSANMNLLSLQMESISFHSEKERLLNEIAKLQEELKVKEFNTHLVEQLQSENARLQQEFKQKASSTHPAEQHRGIAAGQPDLPLDQLKIQWEERASSPVGRVTAIAVMYHRLLYVGGGHEGDSTDNSKYSYRLDVYDPAINEWNCCPITTPYSWFAMTVFGDDLFIVGGEDKNDDVTNRVFVLNGKEWKIHSEMPTARGCATAISYRSCLIVVGGHIRIDGKWTRLGTTEVYDSVSSQWYQCSELPKPHRQMESVIISNVLHVLGGVGSQQATPLVYSACLDSLSSHQIHWQESIPNTPWCWSTAGIVRSRYLATLGGRLPPDKTSQTDQVCVFDPITGVWRPMGTTPEAVSGSVCLTKSGDELFLVGGRLSDVTLSRRVWIGKIVS